jgi:predicted DNA-binding transcriptional regulator AlpA
MSAEVATSREYLDAPQCGERFGFSARHWIRLVDSGRAPKAVKFGRLSRWSIRTLEEWEATGCPHIERRASE